MSILRRAIVNAMHAMRFHAYVWRPERTDHARILYTAREQAVNHVVDVGANTGQFAMQLLEHGYRGRITSFEPLREAHATLVRNAAKHSDWSIADRCAIGASNGSMNMNVSSNSVSSSLLSMAQIHLDSAPGSAVVANEEVPVRTLDDAIGAQPEEARLLLKLDTQGFEFQVLAGAAESLKRCVVLVIEVSLVSLFDGQPLFAQVVPRLTSLGFTVVDILPGFQNPKNGRLLQVDLVAVRI